MARQYLLLFLISVSSFYAINVRAEGVPRASFGGAYIGATIGTGEQSVRIGNDTTASEYKSHGSSIAFGAYAGYSWLNGPFAYGVETDFNYLNASPTAYDIATGPAGLTEAAKLESWMDWFGTVRARAGVVVHPNWLLYATGGLAYAQIKHTLSDNCVGCGNSSFNLGPFSQSNTSVKTGWTVGGGVEVLSESRWRFRAEALYVDLGSDTHTYELATPVATATTVGKWDDRFWVARLGLTYVFGTSDATRY